MNKEIFFKDNNVSEHIIGNLNYDKHLSTLRDIYAKPPYERNEFELKNSSKEI